jgi:hypothetical protein
MTEPTNQDLQIMLVRIEERLISQNDRLDVSNRWQEDHQKSDNQNHKDLSEAMSHLNNLSARVGFVCTVIGASAIYVYKWIKGGA